MRRACLVLPLLGLLLVLAGQVAAAPKKIDPVLTFPKNILVSLTADQKTKLEDLVKEISPRLEEVNNRCLAVVSLERQKSAAEARQKAASAGKKGKDLEDVVNRTLNLSPDEKVRLKEAEAAQGKVLDEIIKRKTSLLTDEQRALLKPRK